MSILPEVSCPVSLSWEGVTRSWTLPYPTGTPCVDRYRSSMVLSLPGQGLCTRSLLVDDPLTSLLLSSSLSGRSFLFTPWLPVLPNSLVSPFPVSIFLGRTLYLLVSRTSCLLRDWFFSRPSVGTLSAPGLRFLPTLPLTSTSVYRHKGKRRTPVSIGCKRSTAPSVCTGILIQDRSLYTCLHYHTIRSGPVTLRGCVVGRQRSGR